MVDFRFILRVIGYTLLLSVTSEVAMASKAYYPYATDSDLKELAMDPQYRNVVQIEITRKDNKILTCSAVKVKNFYLTAAHCLVDAKTVELQSADLSSLLDKTEKVVGYFIHPYYKINPIDDLAGFWTNSKIDNGYEVELNDDALYTTKQTTYVGFGVTRNGGTEKQAFQLCGKLSIDNQANLIKSSFNYEDNQGDVKCGTGTEGDSGGALFLVQNNRLSLYAIGFAGNHINTNSMRFRKLDKRFIDHAATIYRNAINNQNNKDDTLQDFSPVAEKIFPVIDNNLLKNFNVLQSQGSKAFANNNTKEALEKYSQIDDKINICRIYLFNAVANHKELSSDELLLCQSVADTHDNDNIQLMSSIQFTLYEYVDFDTGIGNLMSGRVSQEERQTTIEHYKTYLQKAAYNGYIEAIHRYLGVGKPSADETISLYNKAAARGDAKSQYYLAIIYMPDNIFNKLLQISTRNRYPSALQQETKFRKDSDGHVKKDCQTAMKWLKAATEVYYADAEYVSGILMALGMTACSPPHFINTWNEQGMINKPALDLLKNSERHGNTNARKILSEMYYSGQGVTKDPSLAMHYMIKDIPDWAPADISNEEFDKLKLIFQHVGTGKYLPQYPDSTKKLQHMQDTYKWLYNRHLEECKNNPEGCDTANKQLVTGSQSYINNLFDEENVKIFTTNIKALPGGEHKVLSDTSSDEL